MAEPGPLTIGVAGVGAMGHHHVRLLSSIETADLVGLFDADRERSRSVAVEFDCHPFDSLQALAGACEALVVAVPTEAHLEVARTAAEAGCHLLVEKPLASTLEQARAIVDLTTDRVIAVGHVEFYNPATGFLLDLGRAPRYVEVQRRSGFTRRSLDIDVIRDLMIHDLQLLHELDASAVTEIRALGTAAMSSSVDIANARLEFESGMVANLTASRVSVARERQMRAFFPELYCSIDFDAMKMTRYQLTVDGDGTPDIERRELQAADANPLELELREFIASCRGDEARIVSAVEGLRALDTATRISKVIEESLA